MTEYQMFQIAIGFAAVSAAALAVEIVATPPTRLESDVGASLAGAMARPMVCNQLQILSEHFADGERLRAYLDLAKASCQGS
jgi:hypothetical protein